MPRHSAFYTVLFCLVLFGSASYGQDIGAESKVIPKGKGLFGPLKIGTQVVCYAYDLKWPRSVEKVRGDWLWIGDAKHHGWIQKRAVMTLDEAVQIYSDILRKQPSSFVYLSRGDVRIWKQEYDDAIADYTSALDVADSDELRGWSYCSRAVGWQKKGDNQAAMDDFNQGIRMLSATPRNQSEAYRRRADVHDKMGNKEAAEADRREAKRLELSIQNAEEPPPPPVDTGGRPNGDPGGGGKLHCNCRASS